MSNNWDPIWGGWGVDDMDIDAADMSWGQCAAAAACLGAVLALIGGACWFIVAVVGG